MAVRISCDDTYQVSCLVMALSRCLPFLQDGISLVILLLVVACLNLDIGLHIKPKYFKPEFPGLVF